jgi:hypothetical protein
MFPVPRRPQETATTDGVSRLVRSNETMLISHGDQRLWLQGGRIYDDAGLEISGENVPGWFQEEYKKLHPLMAETHPVDGSEPQGVANRTREQRINELRSQLADLERDQINANAPSRVGEGEGVGREQLVDETDEEHLDKLTKQQILQLIDDEELEVENSTKMKKEELIAAVIEARVNKSANTGQPPDENDDK